MAAAGASKGGDIGGVMENEALLTMLPRSTLLQSNIQT